MQEEMDTLQSYMKTRRRRREYLKSTTIIRNSSASMTLPISIASLRFKTRSVRDIQNISALSQEIPAPASHQTPIPLRQAWQSITINLAPKSITPPSASTIMESVVLILKPEKTVGGQVIGNLEILALIKILIKIRGKEAISRQERKDLRRSIKSCIPFLEQAMP